MTTGAYEFTEVVRGRTEIRFSSLFRRGTEYVVEHVMGYSMYPSPYAPLYSHLRYDVFRDGEFIGQEAEYECALRLVAVDFAYRLWRGPLGVILRDEDKLEELVWWFVREIPEKKGNVNIATNAYRPTETPERKPDPPTSGNYAEMLPKSEKQSSVSIRWDDVLDGIVDNLTAEGMSEDRAVEAVQLFFGRYGLDVRRVPDEVETASVVIHKIIR